MEYLPERVEIDLPRPDQERPEVYFRKDPDWSYENELRLVRRVNKAAKEKPLPAPKLPAFLFAIPPAAIESVTLGMNTSEDFGDEIKAILGKNPKLSHVQLYKATLSRDSFRMERNLIK